MWNSSLKASSRSSLVAWWLRFQAFTVEARVQSLIRELRSHKLCSKAQKKKEKREENIFLILTVRIQKVHLTTSKSAAEGCSNFDQKPSILNSILFIFYKGFPGGEVVKNPHANAGDSGSIPGLGRSPGVGNGNPLWYSCLENPRDRGAWWASPWSHSESHNMCTSTTMFHILMLGHNQMLLQWMFLLRLSKQRSPSKTGTKPYFYLCSPECLAKPWNSVESNVNIC